MRRHVCSVDREFKRHGDCVRIVTSNTLILPTKGKGPGITVIKPLSPYQSKGGEERAEWRRKPDIFLWWTSSHGNMKIGE